jgi:hypothetical protein
MKAGPTFGLPTMTCNKGYHFSRRHMISVQGLRALWLQRRCEPDNPEL